MKGSYYISTYKLSEHEEHKRIMQYLGLEYIAKKRLVNHGRFIYFILVPNATPYQQREAHRLASTIGKPGTDILEWRVSK